MEQGRYRQTTFGRIYIMQEFKSSSAFRYDPSSGGGSGSGPGHGGGSSGSGFNGNPGGHGNQNNQNSQGGYNQQRQQSGYQSNPKQLNSGQYHVFTTSLDKRDRKVQKRAVNSVEPAVPRYLRWSEQPIVWSREDPPPPRVDNPGQLALVVAPQVGGYKFTKVLMDGGSSINILYYETFRCMGLTDKDIRPSNTVFHGVVPGKSAYPVGKIALEVAFGDDHDSRSETLTFEVVKIQ